MSESHSDPQAIRPKVRDDLIFRPLDEEWVVYDASGERLHVFNRTAAAVYLLCTGDCSVDEIVTSIGDELDNQVSGRLLEEDVRKTLAEFADKGLLE